MLLRAWAVLLGGVYRCVRPVSVFLLDEDGVELGETTVDAGTLVLIGGRQPGGFRRVTLDVEGGFLPADDLPLYVAEIDLADGCRFVREG